MTQEDLDALNAFIAKYPDWCFSLFCYRLSSPTTYNFAVIHHSALSFGQKSRRENYKTLAEAIADVVQQMEAAGI